MRFNLSEKNEWLMPAALLLGVLGFGLLVGPASLSRSGPSLSNSMGQRLATVESFPAERGFIRYNAQPNATTLTRRDIEILAARFDKSVNTILNANNMRGASEIPLGPEKQIRIPH